VKAAGQLDLFGKPQQHETIEKPERLTPTPEQREAIEHGSGPMLVVAGAGTGKTTVLASRVVRLIEEGLAEPREILAVTYTRNSASDLLKRIARLWKGSDDPATVNQVAESGLKVGTFHACCYLLLRNAGQRFDLIDDQDLYVLLRRRIEDLKLEYYAKAASPGEFLEGLTKFFKRCHDELKTPDDYDAYVAKLESQQIPLPRVSRSKDAESMPEDEVLGRCREIARVFRYVEDMLAAEKLGTFSHVITRAVALLRSTENAEYLDRARQIARFVLIDEFQDSNVGQIELTRLLAGETANVFAVGDPDQAIYRFRGATAGTFDHFLRTFGLDRVKRVTMSQNRRSTDFILRSAYSVIERNPEITSVELPGGERWVRTPLQHSRTKAEPNPVPPVQIRGWDDIDSEASFVAREIVRLRGETGRPWGDFAVLYRKHRDRSEIVNQLIERGVPFSVTGVDVLQTPEVRDVLAGLRAVVGGDDVALLRVAALPRFQVDGAELRTALATAEECRLEPVLERVAGGAEVITALVEARHKVQRMQSQALAACGIVQQLFGIPPSANAAEFTEFVQSWGRKPHQVAGDGTLTEFLDYLEYFTEVGGQVVAPEEVQDDTPAALQMELGQTSASKANEGDAVQLLTVHAAKGLEFPVVFVLRVMNRSFPTQYKEDLVEFPDELRDPDSRLADDPKNVHSQEERRLFYVAVTRAEDQLILCSKQGTGKDPTPPGYLRNDVLAAGARSNPRFAEYAAVPAEASIPLIEAAVELGTRLAEWMALPALPQTISRRLSASAVENYERCPLSYKLGREWKLPGEPAANLQFGSAMHSALLAYFDAVRKERPMSADEVVSYFLGEFGKMKIDDPTQRRLYERDGDLQLRRFLASSAALPHGKVALVEHTFTTELAGTRVAGRIDRVDEDDDGYVIVDYKTGKPKQQDVADESLQLSTYALAMSAKKPVKLLIFQNLEDNSTVCTTRPVEKLREAEIRIATVAEGIARGNFDATPGTHCAWCGYRTVCPEMEVSLPSRNGKNDRVE
jgi:DNA helicase II / ATP-dependent DNA helicase PcrA